MESAGQGRSCANPVQPGIQASTSTGVSRDHQHVYVQVRLSAIERRMGIDVPAGAQAPEEAMEVLGVILASTLNSQDDPLAPVVDALAPTETNPRGMEGPSPALPSPGMETPDATMIGIPGTEGEGDRNVGRTEEKGTSSKTPVPARRAQGEVDLCLGMLTLSQRNPPPKPRDHPQACQTLALR